MFKKPLFVFLTASYLFLTPSLVSAQASPSPAPDASPCNYNDLSVHEKTLTKLDCFNSPKEISTAIVTKDPGFFSKWIGSANLVLDYFGFKSLIKNQGSFHDRAEIGHTTTLPKEIKADTSNELLQTGEDIGSNTTSTDAKPDTSNVKAATSKEEGLGIFQLDSPKEIEKKTQKPCDFEKLQDNNWFPKGMVPFSGGDCQ